MKISLTSMLAAMLPAGLHAQSATGQSSCKCLGTKAKFHCSATVKSPCIQTLKCAAVWSKGNCINVTSDSVVFRAYQNDYGDSCKVHEEPGSPIATISQMASLRRRKKKRKKVGATTRGATLTAARVLLLIQRFPTGSSRSRSRTATRHAAHRTSSQQPRGNKFTTAQ